MYKVKRFSVIDQKKMDMMTEQREFGNPVNKAAKRLWEYRKGAEELSKYPSAYKHYIKADLKNVNGLPKGTKAAEEAIRVRAAREGLAESGYDILKARESLGGGIHNPYASRISRDFRSTLAGKSGLSRIG